MADSKTVQARNFLERISVKAGDAALVSAVATGGTFWLTYETVARNIGSTDALFVTCALCCAGPPAAIYTGWRIIDALTGDDRVTVESVFGGPLGKFRGLRERVYGGGERVEEIATVAELPPMPNWYETVEDVRNLRVPVFPIGQRLTGGVSAIDLRKTPHLAINGMSGSGKTRKILRPLAAMAAASGQFQVIILDKSGRNFNVLKDETNVWIVRYDHEQLPEITDLIYGQILRRDRWMADRGKNETEISRIRADIRPPQVLVIMDEFANSMTYLQTLPDKSLFNRVQTKMVQISQEGRAMGFYTALGLQRPDHTQISTTLRGQLRGITFFMRSADDARMADAPGAENLPEDHVIMSTTGGYETARVYHPSDDELLAFVQASKPQSLGEPEWLNSFLSSNGRPIALAESSRRTIVSVPVLDTIKNGANGNGYSRAGAYTNGQERVIKNALPVPELTPAAVVRFFTTRYEKHADFQAAPETFTKERVILTALALLVPMSQNEILRGIYGQEKGKEGGRFRDYVRLVDSHLSELRTAWVNHYSRVAA